MGITIRASMLPGYHDCPRRAIARAWPMLLGERGFRIGSGKKSIGAAVGTSAHAAASHLLTAKKSGQECRHTDAADVAVGVLRAEAVGSEMEFDATTGTINAAEQQAIRMSLVFYHQILPECNPETIEERRRATLQGGDLLDGRLDMETLTGLYDWKMGAVPRWYMSQLGAYSILRRSNGGSMPEKLVMVHIPRVRIDKPQPPVGITRYDPATAERSAWSTIGFILRDLAEFSKTGDPWSIAANPASMLCSAKYCPAFGTKFCELRSK